MEIERIVKSTDGSLGAGGPEGFRQFEGTEGRAMWRDAFQLSLILRLRPSIARPWYLLLRGYLLSSSLCEEQFIITLNRIFMNHESFLCCCQASFDLHGPRP